MSKSLKLGEIVYAVGFVYTKDIYNIHWTCYDPMNENIASNFKKCMTYKLTIVEEAEFPADNFYCHKPYMGYLLKDQNNDLWSINYESYDPTGRGLMYTRYFGDKKITQDFYDKYIVDNCHEIQDARTYFSSIFHAIKKYSDNPLIEKLKLQKVFMELRFKDRLNAEIEYSAYDGKEETFKSGFVNVNIKNLGD